MCGELLQQIPEHTILWRIYWCHIIVYLTLILSPNDLYSSRDRTAGKRGVFAAWRKSSVACSALTSMTSSCHVIVGCAGPNLSPTWRRRIVVPAVVAAAPAAIPVWCPAQNHPLDRCLHHLSRQHRDGVWEVPWWEPKVKGVLRGDLLVQGLCGEGWTGRCLRNLALWWQPSVKRTFWCRQVQRPAGQRVSGEKPYGIFSRANVLSCMITWWY